MQQCVSFLRNLSYLAFVMELLDTQQRIIDAAIVVFNEDLSAPLEKVAEAASVTRRTLHRHFKDRNELLVLCERDIRLRCRKAMAEAMNCSSDPLKQLENMLYAGISCGSKYSYFNKLHNRQEHQHSAANEGCAEYDELCENHRKITLKLQESGVISRNITAEWVIMLFSGVIATAINAEINGSVAKNNLKKFAWYSFSRGIGV